MDGFSAFDRYCGSEFWNLTLTWETNNPYFTKCFEKTVLVWIPCVFLWTFASLDVYFIMNSKYKDIQWNWINTPKLIIAGVLCALSVCDLGVNLANKSGEEQIYDVNIYSPVFKILTFALAGLLIFHGRKHGIRTSGLQFIFWFLVAICGIPQLRTEIIKLQKEGVPDSNYEYRSYLIYYPLVVLMFLLHCFADNPPKQANYLKSENPSPETEASFLSRLLFTWYDSTMLKGFRKPLEFKDLFDLKPEDTPEEVIPTFEKRWKEALQKYESPYTSQNGKAQTDFKLNSEKVNVNRSRKKVNASIVPVLINCFGSILIMGALLKLACDVLVFASPKVLGLLITFSKSGEQEWKGYFYAALLFAAATIQTVLLSQYSYISAILGMRIRTALISTIYQKSLKISMATRKGRTTGEIVNLMAIDAQRFMDLHYIHMLWSCPLQICLSMYFLWQELGPAVLTGLLLMILLIPVNAFIANKVKALQIKQMRNKDERVKLMNEILAGMKVLKLYAWEPSFENHILKIRNKEVDVLKSASYLQASTTFIWSCAPFFVSLISFATYVLIDEENVLNANKAYVSIALFNILRGPLTMLPMAISSLIQTWVSVKRINAFLISEEFEPNAVSHEPSEDDAVIIENGSFAWEKEPILKNINIKFSTNSLTAVVGTVGSGKSSLISACLGEMKTLSGRVNAVGTIAYVSQQAWLQNATLQENILFGQKYDKILYEKVIEACALRPDFDMLPASDQTEIGEKGINLSGGQKQRVSLARAVYYNADIYFLDDPLSAVDAHVGKHIFDEVLGPKGLLRRKTRVLVTHGITYLPQTDDILVMKDGEVSESGSYQELLNNKGAFAEFLLQHIEKAVTKTQELDELENQVAGSILSKELQKVLVRQRSCISEARSEGDSHELLRQMSTRSELLRQTSTKSAESIKRQSSLTPSNKNDEPKGKIIETEKAQTGNVSWDVYKHYLQAIGVIIFLSVTLLNVCFQGFSIGSNVWLGLWSEDPELVVNGTVNTERRDMYLTVYGVFGVGQALSTMCANIVFTKGTIDAAVKLHNLLLRNVLRLPMSFFDVTPSGRILGRFSNDINGVDFNLPMICNLLLSNSLKIIGTLAVISYSTPLFIALIIPLGIVYYIIQRFYIATSRQLKRIESISKSPIYSHFGETLTGVQTIRAYKQQERFIQDSHNKVGKNLVCYYPMMVTYRWVAVRLEMIANLVILFAATFAVLNKDTAPAMVGLSITYSLQITQTLNLLVRMVSDVENNMVAVERIKEYGEAPCEAPWEISNKQPAATWPEDGSIHFKNYAVRYRPGLELVLKGVNFAVQGGEKVGIVGRTGAGKSSLTLALFRIIEAANGEIDIDSVNISEIGLQSLRSKLTIIPQEAVLFSGSLRINLDPFNKHTDEELWKCMENAHLRDYVEGLPSGLQHEVTEGGDNLSLGQRQLICLARALLKKTKVLVLDEATAAVDLETDALIQSTIRSEFKDATVLTIAHRLNTILDSDRVIVLDKGQIAEFDTPANLMKKPESIFYRMCQDAGLV